MKQSPPALVLAHELGLNLGLNDITCDPSADPSTWHLMCDNVDQMRANIRPVDCAEARRIAAPLVKQKWGVTVKP